MLLDVWSPSHLTTSLTTPEGLVTFAGFLLIMGTIIGVVIDGIHHLLIEEEILKKYYKVRNIYPYIKDLYPLGLEPNNDDHLVNKHDIILYFYGSLCKKNSPDKGLEIDETMMRRYYRYSEFYANTFISLLLFSLIIPFYLLKELSLKWDLCVLIGLISFLVGIVCLRTSLLAYIRYLRSQIAVVCSYICSDDTEEKDKTGKLKKCINNNNKTDNYWRLSEKQWGRLRTFGLITIINYIIFYFLFDIMIVSRNFKIYSSLIIYGILVPLVIVMIWNYDKNGAKPNSSCKEWINVPAVFLSTIFTIFSIILILFLLNPPLIDIYPRCVNLDTNSISEIIIIKNNGIKIDNITLDWRNDMGEQMCVESYDILDSGHFDKDPTFDVGEIIIKNIFFNETRCPGNSTIYLTTKSGGYEHVYYVPVYYTTTAPKDYISKIFSFFCCR